MKKSGRGAVTRAFIRRRRYREDEEYREKIKQSRRNYDKRNRKKCAVYHRKYEKELSEFANKRCKVCNKLLYYKTKSGLCRNHHPKWKKKK